MGFKGFKQVVEQSGLTFENGYIYFVRTNDAKTEGYIYFNGKKYGNVSELRTELEATITENSKIVAAALNNLQVQIDNINTGFEGRIDVVESGLTELEQTASDNKVTNFEYVASGDSKDLVITLGDGTTYTVDAKNFIKDGMLESANLSEESGVTYLILTFNTEAGKDEIKLDVTTLIDIYTGDDETIKVENNKISAIVDQKDGLVSYNSLETLLTIGGDDVA